MHKIFHLYNIINKILIYHGPAVEPQSTGKVEYLLAAQTLKYKSALLSLVEKVIWIIMSMYLCKLFEWSYTCNRNIDQVAGSDLDEGLFKEIQKGVFLVMVYELLFSGHKSIHGGVNSILLIILRAGYF